jgi:hypothetical protein
MTGPLVVRGSSMRSLAALGHLTSVVPRAGDLAIVGNMSYAVAIYGMICVRL